MKLYEQRVLSTEEYTIKCIHCGAMGAPAQSVEWAAANWNRRAEK